MRECKGFREVNAEEVIKKQVKDTPYRHFLHSSIHFLAGFNVVYAQFYPCMLCPKRTK